MIEFQLTVYMCSHCTIVHNAAQDCVRHELEEHSTTSLKASLTVNKAGNDEQSTTSPSTDQPFTIVVDDVKPDTDDIMQRYGDRHPQNNEPIENEPIIEDEEMIKNQSLDESTMAVDGEPDDAEVERTLRPRRHSRKRTKRASSTSSDDSSKNIATVARTSGRSLVSCKICGLKTKDMTRHLRTHTGEKPYTCQKCDFKCARVCFRNYLSET